MSRSPSYGFSYPSNPLTKGADGSIIKINDEGRKKQEDEDKKRRENPFYDKKVIVKFRIDCQEQVYMTGSEIPAPILSISEKHDQNDNITMIGGKSIGYDIPFKAQIWVDECYWGNFIVKNTHYKEFEVNKKLDRILNSVYKDSVALKDEDVESQNLNNQDSSKEQGVFNFRVEKRNNIDFSWNGKKVNPKDQIYARTRIYGEFQSKELPIKGGKEFNFKINDDKEGFKFLSSPFQRFPNESPKSGFATLDSKSLLMNDPDNIESDIIVNGDNSDTDGRLKSTTHPDQTRSNFKKDLRRINLNFVDENDRKEYQNNLNKSQTNTSTHPNIWIVSHGWCDDKSSFEPIAQEVKKIYPEDIVFTLDWSEASFNDCGIVPGIGNNPPGVARVGTWIKPSAKQIRDKLLKWGLKDWSKLRLVGHSMGTIMSRELSNVYLGVEGKGALLIALDPPAEIGTRDESEGKFG
ncbi:MAG: hypothetical protein ACRCXZ_09505, partial [Patescibacteria group bacterium]